MRGWLFGLGAVTLLVAAAQADPYWIAYEGDDYPENCGWGRTYGNWGGQHQGEADRQIEDGVLKMDSLFDSGVYDYVFIDRPGEMDPGPGETFIMQWRLLVHAGSGWDPAVALSSDDKWMIGLEFKEGYVRSIFEGDITFPVAAEVFHTYEIRSEDMRTYCMYIDGVLRHEGSFWLSVSPAYVAWGDGVLGAASWAEWDYFRFGVAPEPSGLLLMLAAAACYRGRRR
ncbi:MAG: PEP-CTERM sorting domain-containing protein [Phycisphaerae bacterium]|jgi:hypothetical protein